MRACQSFLYKFTIHSNTIKPGCVLCVKKQTMRLWCQRFSTPRSLSFQKIDQRLFASQRNEKCNYAICSSPVTEQAASSLFPQRPGHSQALTETWMHFWEILPFNLSKSTTALVVYSQCTRCFWFVVLIAPSKQVDLIREMRGNLFCSAVSVRKCTPPRLIASAH